MGTAFLDKLKTDFPELRFVEGRKFTFRPPRTIVVESGSPPPLLLLHELGHAILKHKTFKTDAERLRMEMEAWEKARELAIHYDIIFDEALAQSELDTYRKWLHQKSRCPECGLTRFQTPDGQYHCPLNCL